MNAHLHRGIFNSNAELGASGTDSERRAVSAIRRPVVAIFKFKSKFFPLIVFVASLFFARGHSANAADFAASNAIAVLDFESKDTQSDATDWSFGLADVLAVELQQQGIVLFERQQIRVLLSERKITAENLMRLRRSAPQEFPNIQYLVTGNVWALTNGQLHIESSLVNAQTGRNVASFDYQASEEMDLTKGLVSIAGKIAAHLKADDGKILPPHPIVPRINHKPEVALLFYKGIEYCLSGQPEIGVSWFLDAQKADPQFLSATVWTLRAFQMLGLPEFVKVAQHKVQQTRNGSEILERLEKTRLLDESLVSVAIVSDPNADATVLKIQTELKNVFGNHSNLFVADPANIRSLAAEMDLQLIEKGVRDLELASVLWSTVDAIVSIRRVDDSTDGRVFIEVQQARSGETIFSSNPIIDVTQVAKIGNELAEQLSTRRKTVAQENLPRPKPSPPTKSSTRGFNNMDREQFGALLRHTAEHPLDRPALLKLAYFVRWLNAGINGRYDGLYECAISDRILAATPPDDPEAAEWISKALWHRRYYENPLPPINEQFASLIKNYPESHEAYYARSALALELVDTKKYAEATELILKLADELPRLSGVTISPEYWVNFYFFTGASLQEIGDGERAKQFFLKADDILRKHPDLNFFPYAKGVWVNHFPQSHPLFGPERNVRQAVSERLAAEEKTQSSEIIKTNRQRELETLLSAAREVSGKEAVEKCKEFLAQLVDYKRNNPDLFRGKITDSIPAEPWRQIRLRQATTAGNYTLLGKLMIEAIPILNQLAVVADSPKKLQDVRELGEALAENLDPAIAAGVFEAAGQYEMALQQVEKAQLIQSNQIQVLLLRQKKTGLLQMMGRLADAAAYARTQINQPDVEAKLKATIDAANAYVAAGRPDEACLLFSQFVQNVESPATMDQQGASARLWWAEFEIARGNHFEATELLRDVVRQSEGKFWGVYLRGGYSMAYDAALSRLAQLRAVLVTPLHAASADWNFRNGSGLAGTIPPQIAVEPDEMERELNELLLPVEFWGSYSTGGQVGKEFVKKYGRKAVPLLIKNLPRTADIPAYLLARVATPDDAPQVLEAFKKSPQVASTAFRLDEKQAKVILNERFPIYLSVQVIPSELLAVVEKYRIKEQYPVLIANVIADAPNLAVRAETLDRILRHDPSPDLLESFRSALAFSLQKKLASKNLHRLNEVSETCLRYGVAEAVEALVRHRGTSPADALVRLRKFIELPTNDAQAWAVVESGLGRWQWNTKTEKFVVKN